MVFKNSVTEHVFSMSEISKLSKCEISGRTLYKMVIGYQFTGTRAIVVKQDLAVGKEQKDRKVLKEELVTVVFVENKVLPENQVSKDVMENEV